jgi:hypothetical protein
MKIFLAVVVLMLVSAVGVAAQQKPLTQEKCRADAATWSKELSLDSIRRLSHDDLFTRQGEMADCRDILPMPSAFPLKGETTADAAIRYGLQLEEWSTSMKLSWLYAAEVANRATLFINTQGLADKYATFEKGLIANGR